MLTVFQPTFSDVQIMTSQVGRSQCLGYVVDGVLRWWKWAFCCGSLSFEQPRDKRDLAYAHVAYASSLNRPFPKNMEEA